MDISEIAGKLNLLISSGAKISAIEAKCGLPKNNLSGVLGGKKKFPEKWVPKIEAYLNSLEKPSTEPYLICEKEGQLIRMKELGVNVDGGANFEQLVNTVIILAADYKAKWQEAEKKAKEIVPEGMIPPHPKREDFSDSFYYGVAKSEWKKRYNLS